MACLTSMTTIARRRPQFMTEVIQSFESLHGKMTSDVLLWLYLVTY